MTWLGLEEKYIKVCVLMNFATLHHLLRDVTTKHKTIYGNESTTVRINLGFPQDMKHHVTVKFFLLHSWRKTQIYT